MTISKFYLDKNYRLLSKFGNRKDPFTKEIRHHNGIDYGMPLWSKNNSPYNVGIPTQFKGKVHAIGNYGDRGLTVVEHIESTNVLIVFQHLASTTLKIGQKLEPESIIGIMGSTGRSTGIHLHLELRVYSSAPLGSGLWGNPDEFTYTNEGSVDKVKTAVLDPGHGGDGKYTKFGAVGHGLLEKNVVLAIARFSRDHLLNNFVCKVVMTRNSDVDVSYTDRADIARNAKADILHSFHLNGYYDPTANGFESFIFNGSLLQTTVNNQHIIHNEIFNYVNILGIRDRGKKRANFAMLRLPPTSCVLTEYCFLTNPTEAAILKRVGVIEKLGIRTAEGIAKALELPRKITPPVPPPIPPDNQVLYRVIAGTYAELQNARDMEAKLKSLGVKSTFILPFKKG